MFAPRLILVIDPAFDDERTDAAIDAVARAIAPSLFAVQLREKQASPLRRRARALGLRRLTRDLGVGLIVNGDAALALEVAADGLHLPSSSPAVPTFPWLSVAAHEDADVAGACAAGAQAALVSPIFATPGKGTPRGVSAIARVRQLPLAVYALGGVDASNARACAEAGAYGVAVIRALLASSHAGEVAKVICESLVVS
ncbi:MAG: thiamine phosphate synthase [Polyangiaceae bacterium]